MANTLPPSGAGSPPPSGSAFVSWLKRYIPGIGHEEKLRAEREKIERLKSHQTLISVHEDFVHRGRFRGGKVVTIIAFALVGWCVVFSLGRSISYTPFQQAMNIVSVNVGEAKSEEFKAFLDPSAPKPAEPQPAKTESITLGGATVTTSVKEPPPPFRMNRVENFFALWNITSSIAILALSTVICVFTFPYTNILILACLAALVGALSNYAVQALKQAREYALSALSNSTDPAQINQEHSPSAVHPTMFGHRRVFSSVAATVVVGLGLGFAAFLAVATGLLLFPQLEIHTPAGYQYAASIGSLVGFLAALLPDNALLFIETRLNQASQLAVAARQNYQASVAAKLPPQQSPAPRPTAPAQEFESKLDSMPASHFEELRKLIKANSDTNAAILEFLNRMK